MKVSIIVPVYNAEKYLDNCIKSLVGQTYKNIEIIIINDGSIDCSEKIINKNREKDERIVYIKQKNAGPYTARKKGIDNATGDYLMFVDADDWLEFDTVEYLTNILLREKVDIIKFNAIIEPDKVINKVMNFKRQYYFINEEEKTIIYDNIIKGDKFNSLWNQIVRKEICLNSKEYKNLIYGEDLVLNCDIYTKASKMIILNKCFYHYRQNPNSTTNSLDYEIIQKSLDNIFEVFKIRLDYVKKWNMYNDENIRIMFNNLLEFISLKMFDLFKLKHLENNKMKKVILQVINNNVFYVYSDYIEIKNIKDGSIKKRIFKRLLIKKEINQLMLFIKIIRILYY